MPRLDYFAILGVNPGASDEEIKKAYRRLVFQYHPDRNRGNTAAEAKIREINAAYEILGNPDSRQAYERLRFGGYHPSTSSYGTASEETPNPAAVFQAMAHKLEDEARRETFQLLMKNISKIKEELAVIRQRVVDRQGYDTFQRDVVMARAKEAVHEMVSPEMAARRQRLLDVALHMLLAQSVVPSSHDAEVQALYAQLENIYDRGWMQGYMQACELFYTRQ